MISTNQLVEKLEQVNPNGLQISHRAGIINLTKAVYIRKSFIFVFNMEEAFVFKSANGYTKDEFLSEYPNSSWKIEDIIS